MGLEGLVFGLVGLDGLLSILCDGERISRFRCRICGSRLCIFAQPPVGDCLGPIAAEKTHGMTAHEVIKAMLECPRNLRLASHSMLPYG